MAQKKIQDNKVVLSISLLVSNRIDTIRKCMESIKPILQELPSELIAVDTVEEGKSDGSIEVVREYTEKIIPFTWCGDFSAARNAGLDRARGQWFLYIDDDEWFEDVSPIIDFFKSGEYRKYNSASYMVRNYTNLEGTNWVETMAGRMFPIKKNERFVGKVHEMVPAYAPECMLSCYVHHYGYVFRNEAEKAKHIERNLAMLLEEYKEDKGNHRTAAHLIQEYEGSGRYRESLEIIRESAPISTYTLDHRFWHYLKVHEVLDSLALKELDRAYESGAAYLQGDDLLLGAQIAIGVLMVELCDMRGENAEGMRYLKRYLEQIEELEHCKDKHLRTVLDIGQLWSERNIRTAYARGVNLAYRMGDYEEAASFIQKIDWRAEELIVAEGTVDNTFHYFENAPFEPWMTQIMEAMLERGFAKGGVDRVLAAWPSGSPERKRLLRLLSSCKTPSVQVSVYRAEYATLTTDAELLRQALQELADNPDGNLLMLNHNTLQFMRSAGIEGARYVEKVPFYKWDLCVGQWAGKRALDTRRTDCFLWRGMMPAEPLYLLYMEVVLEEEEIRADMGKYMDFITMHRNLLRMAQKTHELYSCIYHPDAFAKEEMFTILPPNAQFAVKYLRAAECLEEGDGKSFASLVREAGICDVSKGDTCRKLLEMYQKHSAAESQSAQTELAVLIRRLKGKAEELWESGREEEAVAIVRQILQVQPDEELAAQYHITNSIGD